MHSINTEFTPVAALVGGSLIGLAAVALLALNGRIAGVSGILNGAVRRGQPYWQIAFLLGLAAGAAPFVIGDGSLHVGRPIGTAIIAGLLVGFGTSMGGGCTSGHGVCGLGRLSARSLAATITFLIAGVATVYLVRHVLA